MVHYPDRDGRFHLSLLIWRWDWRMVIVGLYYILCLVLTTTVSSWVTQWVAQHGWVPFNRYLRITAVFCGIVLVCLIARKVWKREGSLLGWFLITGTGVALYLLARHLVILGSEYIHYPEYAGLYILLFWATRGHIPWSLGLSAAAGTFDEAIQAFIPRRVLDINDVLLNVAGSLVGVMVVWLLWPVRSQEHGS